MKTVSIEAFSKSTQQYSNRLQALPILDEAQVQSRCENRVIRIVQKAEDLFHTAFVRVDQLPL
jgi:hypothetical protein